MMIKTLPLVLTVALAPTAMAGFDVIDAHALASVQIGDGPAILDEDWDLPLEVCAFAAGPQGIGSSTGAAFDIGSGMSGTATAHASGFVADAVLASGTLMDFSFVVDGDVTASLSLDMLLITNGDAFGAVNFALQDITEGIVLVDLEQTQGSTSMTSAIDLIEGHTYQVIATADADIASAQALAASTSTLSFQILLPAPGALVLLGCLLAGPRRRRGM
ncbi:MAG: hypothetical protein MK101_11365 [Phycisphaerales bacterium]|nr:hypothetical protein [Phycisphaerales bacterium]